MSAGRSAVGAGAVRGDVLGRLKSDTAAVHERVEAMLPLLDPALTRDAYRGVLAAFLGFYRPLERALWRHAPALAAIGLHAAERVKTPLLEHDLRALGASDAAIGAARECAPLPDVGDLARAVGSLYVLEGATLGGRVIARHVARSIGVGEANGGAFFAAYGERVGAMWTAYRDAVAGYVDDGGDEDAIIAGAVETFGMLERWLGNGQGQWSVQARAVSCRS